VSSAKRTRISCLVLGLGLAVAACHAERAASPKPLVPSPAGLTPTPVPDEAFASSVHRLLRDGAPGPGRANLLAGAMVRALVHAGDRFAEHSDERGMASLTGALYLARPGELSRATLFPGGGALRDGIAFVSQRGDEGRALALLSLRRSTLPEQGAERRDTDEHLAALTRWLKDTVHGDSVEALGDAERTAVARALLEPTPEATAAARDAVMRWIDRSLPFLEERTPGTRPRREDAMEAFRAFRSGAQTLVALYLRNGDAAGAFAELSTGSMRKITPPPLVERIDAAANGGDASAWRELLVWLWSPKQRGENGEGEPSEEPEFTIDPNLERAALWGTAVEAYRRDPTGLDVNIALSTLLVQLGLPEAAPLVLADGVQKSPEPTKLNASLRFVLSTILREDEAEDAPSARRVYAAADPLLSLASRTEYRGKLDPSPARVRLVMGSIETRAANLAAARALLESCLALEPSADALLALSAIERQESNLTAAATDLARALELTEAQKNPLTAGEVRLRAFEIQRDLGATDRAHRELALALSLALDAKKQRGEKQQTSRAERLVARALDRFSDRAGASRALERAYTAARDDKHELTATLLDAGARALVLGDAGEAKVTVDRALSSGLADEDLVYVAIWVQLVQKSLHLSPDATGTRALASIRDDGRWIGRLASWGLGRIKDGELASSARTVSQKTEASFYLAMARRAAGDVAGGETGLRDVAKSPAIDLVEVQLARDLLAGPARNLTGPPPIAVP
jgi:cellulose synthase operon protein C